MLEVRLLYKQLENYNQVLDRRCRSGPLSCAKAKRASQPRRTGLRLVLEQDEKGFSARFPARFWRCSASRSRLCRCRKQWQDDWLERDRAASAAGQDCGPAAIPGFRLQPRQCDGSQQKFRVSGEPMFNQHCGFIGYAESAWRSLTVMQHGISIARHVIAP